MEACKPHPTTILGMRLTHVSFHHSTLHGCHTQVYVQQSNFSSSIFNSRKDIVIIKHSIYTYLAIPLHHQLIAVTISLHKQFVVLGSMTHCKLPVIVFCCSLYEGTVPIEPPMYVGHVLPSATHTNNPIRRSFRSRMHCIKYTMLWEGTIKQ